MFPEIKTLKKNARFKGNFKYNNNFKYKRLFALLDIHYNNSLNTKVQKQNETKIRNFERKLLNR